jgi:hypothetical protein
VGVLIKNAGGLLNMREYHLQIYPLPCFSWASHAVVRINSFIQVLQTCDRSHGFVVDAVLERDKTSGSELLRLVIVLSRLGYPQRPSVIEVGCFILIGPGIEALLFGLPLTDVPFETPSKCRRVRT